MTPSLSTHFDEKSGERALNDKLWPCTSKDHQPVRAGGADVRASRWSCMHRDQNVWRSFDVVDEADKNRDGKGKWERDKVRETHCLV